MYVAITTELSWRKEETAVELKTRVFLFDFVVVVVCSLHNVGDKREKRRDSIFLYH